MNCAPFRLALLVIPLVLACFPLSPRAGAVCLDGCDDNFNTFQGDDALQLATGTGNSAFGWRALSGRASGANNTAVGVEAMLANTHGYYNTAVGAFALFDNTDGASNNAVGFDALAQNTTGSGNIAVGFEALINNTTGNSNIALGFRAGRNIRGSHNIDIGNPGRTGESGIIRLGMSGTQIKTFIAGISGVTVPGGVGVIVDSDGQLGTVVSSKRYKDDIKPMDKASETILALKPVTFRYKHELDPKGIPQFGLVAEEVEKVNPDLVARDEQGKP
jgi:hypothetical protein